MASLTITAIIANTDSDAIQGGVARTVQSGDRQDPRFQSGPRTS